MKMISIGEQKTEKAYHEGFKRDLPFIIYNMVQEASHAFEIPPPKIFLHHNVDSKRPYYNASAHEEEHEIHYYLRENEYWYHDENVLQFITYHEMAHLADRHRIKSKRLSWAISIASFALIGLDVFLLKRNSKWTCFPSFVALYTTFQLDEQMHMKLGRYQEQRADQLACDQLIKRKAYDAIAASIIVRSMDENQKYGDEKSFHPNLLQEAKNLEFYLKSKYQIQTIQVKKELKEEIVYGIQLFSQDYEIQLSRVIETRVLQTS